MNGLITKIVVLLALFAVSKLSAQPTSPPPAQDPLLSLMLSQPKIDVESPVNASVMFDPQVVKPGEKSIYRLSFNALEESVELPATLPATPKVEVEPSGHGQTLSMVGAKLQPRTSFNFRIRAKVPGHISIPSFKV